MDFIDDMSVDEFVEFIKLIKEKEAEERLFQQWCAMLPPMSKYTSFEEFKDILQGVHIDTRPAEVIIAEIEELHRQKGE